MNNKVQNALDILDFYAAYDLNVAGKINKHTAFEIIEKIEKLFSVDTIEFSDGTKIWNLLRIFFYSNFQSQKNKTEMKLNLNVLKTSILYITESLKSINIPDKKMMICGFSSTENRRLVNEFFYDIYLDPLYDALGEKLCVFEWTTDTGHRRKSNAEIYSNNYVPIHIPAKVLWQLALYKIGKNTLQIKNEYVLLETIKKFAEITSIDSGKLRKDVYDFIAVFFYVKIFLYDLLKKLNPKAIVLECGYNRLHMALSQACKELNIPSIELQHGLITKYHLGYMKSTESKNRDCVPDYILTHGKAYSEIIKQGNLFDKRNVIDCGFPYLEEVITSPANINNKIKNFLAKFDKVVLITSQWILSKDINKFVVKLSEKLQEKMPNVGIILKPHPNDHTEYSDMARKNIFVADKYDNTYEILKVIDVQATVYSTTGIEALVFKKPNILIDIKNICKNIQNKELYIVSTPNQFIEKLEYIIANYKFISEHTIDTSEIFFKSNAKESIKTFFGSVKNEIL